MASFYGHYNTLSLIYCNVYRTHSLRFKDGIEIEEGWKFKMTQSDERNFSLTIEKFGDADSGKYSCKAFNQAGEAITHGSLAMKRNIKFQNY